MILMEHSTEPIPLSLFSKKDRNIIDTHFKVIDEHKEKEIVDIPLSKPFKNKERGRPEKLPKNILINKKRKGQIKQNIKMVVKKDEPKQNITMDIEENEEPEQPIQQPKKKNKKYATEEERKEAIKQQKRDSAKRRRDAKKGKGLIDDIGKNNISNNNIMPKFVKGSKDAREYMAKIRGLRGAKKNSMSKNMGYESDSSSSSDDSMKGKGIEARIPMPSRSSESFLPHQFSKGHSGSDSADALHQSKLGRGLYASGGEGLYASGGSLIEDAVSSTHSTDRWS
jgi:hypothetical protein